MGGVDDFKIDLDELDAVIGDVERTEGSLERLTDDLEKQMKALHDVWEGLAAQAHTEAHQQWNDGMSAMRDGDGGATGGRSYGARQPHLRRAEQPPDVERSRMRLDVQASGYDTAAEALVGANQGAAMAFEGLTSKLTGFHALGGDDKSSEDFVKEYDASAQEAVDSLRALVDGLGNLGEITAASVENHRRAHAESVYGKPRPSYEGGVLARDRSPSPRVSLPSSLGGDNEDMPDWWNHVVDHLQGWGWPSANTDQLRSAASAWKTAAGQVNGLTGTDRHGQLAHLRGQRSPEIPTATGCSPPPRATSGTSPTA